jgi:hypothetical protein
MRISLVVAAGIAAITFPGAALSGEGCGGAQSVVQHIFDAAVADGSGTLSPAEYDAAGLERFGVTFTASDTDGDGETSKGEYFELYERHHSTDDRVSI